MVAQGRRAPASSRNSTPPETLAALATARQTLAAAGAVVDDFPDDEPVTRLTALRPS